MRIIAAYLLAVLGGNSSPSGSDIKKILESVGVEAEDEKIELLVGELSGKDVFEVIEEGKKKLGAVPVGAAAPAAAAAAPAAGGAAPAAKAEEKKKEEEEDDDVFGDGGGDGGMGLFGGDEEDY
ncbi:60s Acidic ribosomal protein [Acanthamoeba castellanii str. Neff]|jgi:large subunit ribosomal protein LP2|uniref:60s Acidic ribosomal protein n=1 Tax=Acanthamoeba castellanii (strain ATCC 30010 / Neff) TaxID=1257118 RepID=L8H6U1_ACACF|nr:60s Acidic ribosomal protein [Acanthamoeba castellanii str. Neff]ELR20865.1 60s Acidic ribosomal protein [Acanthamoeba castellanii str. Neff]